jgi:dolichol-phosphate mannosyltransferase
MHEALACAPDEPYGATKLAGGHLARVAAREAGIESAHLRPFSVYGPGEDPRRLVTSVVRALLARRPVPLTAGEQGRDFVYVDDVADVCLAAALRPGIDGLTANVGSGVETTVRALCTTIADLTGGHALLRFGERPYSPTERFRWRADPRHAERTLGWRASTPLPEGLARTVDAERGAGGLRAAA